MSLIINLATRGRPEILLDTVARTLPNIARPDTVFVISADDDDQPTIGALRRLPDDKRIVPLVMPREDSVGAKWNRALALDAAVYMVMTDYAPHLTPGFDQKIIEAAALFPDNIGVVYSHLANASFPSLNAVTKGLADRMGFIYPEYFPYWFVDHWLDDIARLIDRIAFADIKVDCSSRKQPTQELREPLFWATFFDVLQPARRRIAHAIINDPAFLEAPWRKKILLSHHPLIEVRSAWVNSLVKGTKALPLADGGPRYQRLKANALKIIESALPEIERAWSHETTKEKAYA